MSIASVAGRLCWVAALSISLPAGAQSLSNLLWYDKPATDWEKEALPIGNGRIGAMVFGGTTSERLQIAEKSLWTGGPGTEGGYDYGLPADSQAALMSSIGKKLLDNWDHLIARFVKVMPIEYKRVIERRRSNTRPRSLQVAAHG